MAYSRSKFGDVTSQANFQVGQFSVTTSAATMDSGFLNSGVRLRPLGTANIVVGGPNVAVDNGYVLESEVFIDVDDMNKVFVRADATGSTVTFIAT
jgi:hypothetical protein